MKVEKERNEIQKTNMKNRKPTRQEGITLLVLVITIVILLILAGITISAITGENGIIENAGQAKEKTEISEEKEIVEKATVQAMGNNKYGNIEEKELQEQLNKETGDGKTEAVDIGDEFEVLFTESNRYYTVDKQGNVTQVQDIIEDKYPGDITVGIDGKELAGNATDPYEIWCIEDLVSFSNIVNGSGIKFEDGEPVQVTTATQSVFSGKYIVLKANLNFKSRFSYQNSERTDFGDINGNAEDGNTLMNEMLTGIGGLIGRGGTINLENCYNLGNITANKASAGGMIGYTNTTNIDSCYNKGNVNGNYSGGIVGYSYYSTPLTVLNSYNSGKITGTNDGGGIVGYQNGVNSSLEIKNTYNIGSVEGKNVGGILNSNISIPTIENCYNAGELEGSNIEAAIIGYGSGGYVLQGKILNCFFLDTTDVSSVYTIATNDSTRMSKNEMQSQNFVDKLNNYILNNSKGWTKWVLGETGYPIFEL